MHHLSVLYPHICPSIQLCVETCGCAGPNTMKILDWIFSTVPPIVVCQYTFSNCMSTSILKSDGSPGPLPPPPFIQSLNQPVADPPIQTIHQFIHCVMCVVCVCTRARAHTHTVYTILLYYYRCINVSVRVYSVYCFVLMLVCVCVCKLCVYIYRVLWTKVNSLWTANNIVKTKNIIRYFWKKNQERALMTWWKWHHGTVHI